MTDRRLQVFCTAADCLSFSKAAELLGMTQPAVTKHIAVIEEELGTALFLRLGRTLILTEKGNELLTIARESLEKYQTSDRLKR